MTFVRWLPLIPFVLLAFHARSSDATTESHGPNSVCPRIFEDPRVLKMVDTYEKILHQYQWSTTEDQWREILKANLNRHEFFRFETSGADTQNMRKIFDGLESLLREGKFPDQTVFDAQEVRGHFRKTLERLSTDAEARAVAVAEAVRRTVFVLDRPTREVGVLLSDQWLNASLVDSRFKTALFASKGNELEFVSAISGKPIRSISGLPKDPYILGADPNLTRAVLRASLGHTHPELWDLEKGLRIRELVGDLVLADFSEERGVIHLDDGSGFQLLNLRTGDIEEKWSVPLSGMNLGQGHLASKGKKILFEEHFDSGTGLRIWDEESRKMWSGDEYGKMNRMRPIYASNDDFSRIFVRFETTGADEKGDAKSVLFGPNGPIEDVEFSPRSTMQYTGRERQLGKVFLLDPDSKLLEAFDLSTGRKLFSFPRFKSDVQEVAVTPDGKTAIALLKDGAMSAVDVLTGLPKAEFAGGHTVAITKFVFTPTSRAILTGDEAGRVIVWDLVTGNKLEDFRHTSDGRITFLGLSPSAKFVMTGSVGKSVVIWDLAKLKDFR